MLLAALGRVLPLPSLAEVGAAAAEQGVCAPLTEQVVVTVAAAQGVRAPSPVDVVVAAGTADRVAALTGGDVVVVGRAADRVDEPGALTFSMVSNRVVVGARGRRAVAQVDVDRGGRVGERDGVLVGAAAGLSSPLTGREPVGPLPAVQGVVVGVARERVTVGVAVQLRPRRCRRRWCRRRHHRPRR